MPNYSTMFNSAHLDAEGPKVPQKMSRKTYDFPLDFILPKPYNTNIETATGLLEIQASVMGAERGSTMKTIDEIMEALRGCTGMIRRTWPDGTVCAEEEDVIVPIRSDTNWIYSLRIEKDEEGELTYREVSHFRDTFCSPDAPHHETAPSPLTRAVVEKYQKSIASELRDPQYMGDAWGKDA